MGWEDRHYYRDRSYSTGNPLLWLLTGSVPLFTAFGIRVRMHAAMILFMGLTLLFSQTQAGLGMANALTAMTILFLSVLLHEFGHCFAARWVGGDAREILMWPLGGLAFTEPPRRPWPSFLTTAAGPAVNLLICLATGIALYVISRSAGQIPWFPLRDGLKSYVPTDNVVAYYLFWIFTVNYILLLFNLLLVFYPFDGGRMIQEVLWWRMGYYRSMMLATSIGMVGAVLVAAFGLVNWSLLLLLIAGFGFYTCWRQRAELKAAGPWAFEEETDYSASYESQSPPPQVKRKKLSRWAIRRARKILAQEHAEQERIDTILAKVSASGIHSLTWRERRCLRKATERQRRSDEELSKVRLL